MNKYVNKKYVSEYLEKEIKEISQRWAGFMINKRAILKEKKTWTEYTNEEKDKYEKMTRATQSLNEKGRKKYLAKLSEEEQVAFIEYSEHIDKEKTLESARKGLKEFEEFLEIATDFKDEIQELK